MTWWTIAVIAYLVAIVPLAIFVSHFIAAGAR